MPQTIFELFQFAFNWLPKDSAMAHFQECKQWTKKRGF